MTTFVSHWVVRSPIADATVEGARSASTLALLSFALWVVYRLMRPLDRFDRVLLTGLIGLVGATFAIAPIRRFFELDLPAPRVVVLVGSIVTATVFAARLVVWSKSKHSPLGS